MRTYRLSGSTFLGCFLIAVPFSYIAAADIAPAHDPSDVPLVAEPIRQAMQDGDYAAARKAIDEALKSKAAPSDHLAYLKAWSLHLEKHDGESIAAFEMFERDYPQSPWAAKARFAKAQAMAAKGDFRHAEAIYEQAAKELLSDGRKYQSAAIYREFADAAYRPAKENEKPDFAKASSLYTRALQIGLDPIAKTEVEFRVAQCMQQLGMHEEASKAYSAFIENHRDAPQAIEARYRLGETLLAAGKPLAARRAWTELLALTPAAKEQSDFYAEAAYHLAETWADPITANVELLRHAEAALEGFVKRYPDHPLAGQAQLDIARYLWHRNKSIEAIAMLDRFMKDPRYKNSKLLPDAAMAKGNFFLKQRKYTEAVAVWHDFLLRFPSDPNWGNVQHSIIDTEYVVAIEQFKAGDDAAATKLFDEFLAHYPLDGRDPGIMFLYGQVQYRQKHWEAAIAAWDRLVAKYPNSEEASHAAFSIAETFENRLGRFEEARLRYANVRGNDAAEAQQASATLAGKSMQLTTERVFHSSETPHVNLASRNLADFKVRTYKIDLETYFRKMHSIAGIDRLDVSLIDPDVIVDFKVPDFAKYKASNCTITTPLPRGRQGGRGGRYRQQSGTRSDYTRHAKRSRSIRKMLARRIGRLRYKRHHGQAVARRAAACVRWAKHHRRSDHC